MYLAPGNPIHVDFCAWTCTGIYERLEDQCVVSRTTLALVILAGSGLSLFCICVIAYNSAYNPAVRTVGATRRAATRTPQRSHVLVSLAASRDGRASTSHVETSGGGPEDETSFHV
jgi:hypothetical protein